MIQRNDWVPASEFVIREMNSLRGKMCSVIEGMHLPEKQERAAIALVKQLSYQTQDTVSQLLDYSSGTALFRYQNDKIEMKSGTADPR
jgi:hypothetical protein